MSEDLRDKITAAIDTAEQVARAANQAYPYAPGAEPPATGVHWRWVMGPRWESVDLDAAEEFVAEPGHRCWLATVEEWPDSHGRPMPRTYMTEIGAVEFDAAAARLIVLNDPAAVLRRCAADRRVLDLIDSARIKAARIDARERNKPNNASADPEASHELRLYAAALETIVADAWGIEPADEEDE